MLDCFHQKLRKLELIVFAGNSEFHLRSYFKVNGKRIIREGPMGALPFPNAQTPSLLLWQKKSKHHQKGVLINNFFLKTEIFLKYLNISEDICSCFLSIVSRSNAALVSPTTLFLRYCEVNV